MPCHASGQRSSKQKISKAMEIINDKIKQLDLIDILRTLHAEKPKYIFFSSTHGTFSRSDHMLLLLSCFSRVQLCATPEMAAHQAPPSLGFSRQEHWSGLPFPSPMHESEK